MLKYFSATKASHKDAFRDGIEEEKLFRLETSWSSEDFVVFDAWHGFFVDCGVRNMMTSFPNVCLFRNNVFSPAVVSKKLLNRFETISFSLLNVNSMGIASSSFQSYIV